MIKYKLVSIVGGLSSVMGEYETLFDAGRALRAYDVKKHEMAVLKNVSTGNILRTKSYAKRGAA